MAENAPKNINIQTLRSIYLADRPYFDLPDN